jgi:prefoldin alpha subunit
MRKGVQFLNDSKQADKKKTLISIGGGAYVEALFPDIRSALVYVGAGYLVERSVAEAKAIVEDNKNKQEEMLKKLDAERRKLQSELISISYRIETMQQQQV